MESNNENRWSVSIDHPDAFSIHRVYDQESPSTTSTWDVERSVATSNWDLESPPKNNAWDVEPSPKLNAWNTQSSSSFQAYDQANTSTKNDTIKTKSERYRKKEIILWILIGFSVGGIALAAVTTAYVLDLSSQTTSTTTAAFIDQAFWPLDNNTLELYNGLNGVLSGTPSYTTSFLGYGAAISLSQASSQYVYISPTVIPLDSRSFTIEAWIYPIGFTASDFGIFGQCQATITNRCLHFTSRNIMLYCGFFANDIAGVTTLTMNAWSHVACVYDSTARIQQVWLNGVLDASRSASPYQGLYGATTIGATFSSGVAAGFNGYIDQVRFESRAKNATELLNDATLYVYYSFDGGSLVDNGINGINGTASGSVVSTTGRLNGAVQFSSSSYIYYTYPPFYFLGISNQSFSISLWANPTGSYAASTLVYVLQNIGWCVHFIVMNSTGLLSAHLWNGHDITATGSIIPLNSWTHIGYTYSYSNGLRLYINGNLYSFTGSFIFTASGVPMHMILGSDGGGTNCAPGYGGPFTGALDEFYLHTREITASEVQKLANP
ncbi:unnamed protein product [Rotaria socialis]|uniref:LamG-like jellyroll fold domain-containing protein n=1 Tax=Rotaria socialis TaxID=392032 RepID=A0A817WPD7_9BILA|nr:unnamed protein product [Rotaria socialis]CAF4548625.1 unnamed protein product [Rotaria socialis]